jgi:hypothetical protein
MTCFHETISDVLIGKLSVTHTATITSVSLSVKVADTKQDLFASAKGAERRRSDMIIVACWRPPVFSNICYERFLFAWSL